MDLADLETRLSAGSSALAGDVGLPPLRCDSRVVAPGDVFVAVRGTEFDGHDFIADAVARGAAVIIAERPVPIDGSAELLLVPDSSEALGRLAQAAYGRPAEGMTVLAVTGTNGKTTVAYLVRSMLSASGRNCGLIGTIEYDLGVVTAPQMAVNTTPGSLELARLMEQMRRNGLDSLAMECSSHGLAQHRTAGIRFSAAAFTNLSGDHLDYHGTQQAYLEAKTVLFENLERTATAVLNDHDANSEYLERSTSAAVWRYSIDGQTPISAKVISSETAGCRFELNLFGKKGQVRSPLIGVHNVCNCLAAAGLASAAGADIDQIATAIESFAPPPGRLERIDCGQSFAVLIDYAHTDDALLHTLETLRKLKIARLIVVFGCGGDRDKSKRPRMAAVAEKWADKIIITSDNPRTEPPEDIMDQIVAGLSAAGSAKLQRFTDRREAIAAAIEQAGGDDLVLIAGKGHETYQEIAGQKYDFDDRQVARQILSDSQYCPSYK